MAEPTLEAPTPSNLLAFVKDIVTPIIVAITINQKNLDVKLNLLKNG